MPEAPAVMVIVGEDVAASTVCLEFDFYQNYHDQKLNQKQKHPKIRIYMIYIKMNKIRKSAFCRNIVITKNSIEFIYFCYFANSDTQQI